MLWMNNIYFLPWGYPKSISETDTCMNRHSIKIYILGGIFVTASSFIYFPGGKNNLFWMLYWTNFKLCEHCQVSECILTNCSHHHVFSALNFPDHFLSLMYNSSNNASTIFFFKVHNIIRGISLRFKISSLRARSCNHKSQQISIL